MKKQKIIDFGKKIGISDKFILKILEKITGLNSSQFFLVEEIEDIKLYKIKEYFMRIVKGEPIDYIINNAEFYGLDFYVDHRVLVPRNDTELMVEQVLKYIYKQTILIDVGTGSSCIPISILKNLNKNDKSKILKTYVIDISEKVLEVSKINIKKHNLESEIIQIQSDLLSKFKLQKKVNNIIITANLPYIKDGDFENMDNEIIQFEPNIALYGGYKTGFELYKKLIFQIFEIKIKNIILFIEIGFDQKEIAKNFFKKHNLQFEIFKDNGGIDRCVKIYF